MKAITISLKIQVVFQNSDDLLTDFNQKFVSFHEATMRVGLVVPANSSDSDSLVSNVMMTL